MPTATLTTALTAQTTEALAKGWRTYHRDGKAAAKIKATTDKERGKIADELDSRLTAGDIVTIDGNRRVEWVVSAYPTDKASAILKALLPFLTPEQLVTLDTIKNAKDADGKWLNKTDVRKLSFKELDAKV